MEQSQKDKRPHVVVLGAGFGGLNAARALGKLPVRVTVVDRKNHHTFQPLLYQVATAGLSAADSGVVRAGRPGVEPPCATGEISRTVLFHDFRNMDPPMSRMLLLE